jgi:hypothetical protein
MLLFRQGEINGPAAADVGSWAAEVVKDGLVGAGGFFQCIGQDSEAGEVQFTGWQEAFFVGRPGEPCDGSLSPQPFRDNSNGWEGIAADTMEQTGELNTVSGP